MNRLILIGNGFDLAHGLKTSYNDFIEYLWYNIYKDIFNIAVSRQILYGEKEIGYIEDKNKLIEIKLSLIYIRGEQILINSYMKGSLGIPLIKESLSKGDLSKSLNNFIKNIQRATYKSSNLFFDIISENYINKKWSDIEADYYKCLIANKDNEAKIARLNQDFDQIKELLRVYLSGLEKPKEIEEINTLIYTPIRRNDVKIDANEVLKNEIRQRVENFVTIKQNIEWLNENIRPKQISLDFSLINPYYRDRSIDEVVSWILRSEYNHDLERFFMPYNISILNFNYTATEELYNTDDKKSIPDIYKNINIEVNHIHGTIDIDDNHMIFGYGDEEADEYKELEKIETKGLLENVKSINYLKTSNYRDLERFIESDIYQIYIMGMSCGMADRTILRKLFQHKNCISIKPFYYQKLDKDGNPQWDNYTEIVQNISRCFNDKDLLRSTVVNKRYCTPLPQINNQK